jgi:hypothetical protein
MRRNFLAGEYVTQTTKPPAVLESAFGYFYKSGFRHPRAGGNPAKSMHWIPGQARNDDLLKLSFDNGLLNVSKKIQSTP